MVVLNTQVRVCVAIRLSLSIFSPLQVHSIGYGYLNRSLGKKLFYESGVLLGMFVWAKRVLRSSVMDPSHVEPHRASAELSALVFSPNYVISAPVLSELLPHSLRR